MALKPVREGCRWIQHKNFLSALACLACVVLGIVIARWRAPQIEDASLRRPIFLLLGDSLTEFGDDPGARGWVWRLRQAYGGRAEVVNRGVSGWNTRQFREQALPIIAGELTTGAAPTLITLWFGANDAALLTGPSAGQHIPVHEYQANLVHILTTFRSLAPHTKIILISPPVVDDGTRLSIQVGQYGRYASLDRSHEAAGIYAAAAAEAAGVVGGVTFLDMFAYLNSAFSSAFERRRILGDGLHFNAEGNRVVFEEINDQIRLLMTKASIHTIQHGEITAK